MTDKIDRNIQEIILGKVPSKSNCYKVTTICGHSSLGKTKAMKEYEQHFYLQCRHRGLKIKGFFTLTVKVFYENNRPDLDNSLKVILDCLQQCNVIDNDRYCTEIHASKHIDKANPRIEIEITY
jgi:Holliday junction resolvase RusA-like endonuclease